MDQLLEIQNMIAIVIAVVSLSFAYVFNVSNTVANNIDDKRFREQLAKKIELPPTILLRYLSFIRRLTKSWDSFFGAKFLSFQMFIQVLVIALFYPFIFSILTLSFSDQPALKDLKEFLDGDLIELSLASQVYVALALLFVLSISHATNYGYWIEKTWVLLDYNIYKRPKFRLSKWKLPYFGIIKLASPWTIYINGLGLIVILNLVGALGILAILIASFASGAAAIPLTLGVFLFSLMALSTRRSQLRFFTFVLIGFFIFCAGSYVAFKGLLGLSSLAALAMFTCVLFYVRKGDTWQTAASSSEGRSYLTVIVICSYIISFIILVNIFMSFSTSNLDTKLVLVLFVTLPLANSVFDLLTWTATRYILGGTLKKLQLDVDRSRPKRAFETKVHLLIFSKAALDLVVGILLFCTTVVVVSFVISPFYSPQEINGLWIDVRTDPFGAGLFITGMVASTLFPTACHFVVGCASIVLVPFSAVKRFEVSKRLSEIPDGEKPDFELNKAIQTIVAWDQVRWLASIGIASLILGILAKVTADTTTFGEIIYALARIAFVE